MDSMSIRHMVIFNLKHDAASAETKTFLSDGQKILTSIPGVKDFEALAQVSPKSDYSYGFSMTFENQNAYDAYNMHPLHVGFVNERWLKEVSEFQEIDFKLIQP